MAKYRDIDKPLTGPVKHMAIREDMLEYANLVKEGKNLAEISKEMGIYESTLIFWARRLKEEPGFEDFVEAYKKMASPHEYEREQFYTMLGLKLALMRAQGLHWVEIAAEFDVNMSTLHLWRKNPKVAEFLEVAEPKYMTYWLQIMRKAMQDNRSNATLVVYALRKWVGLYEEMTLDDRFNIVGDEKQKAVYERITQLIEKNVIEKFSIEAVARKQQIETKVES